jgi:hypothetical protein
MRQESGVNLLLWSTVLQTAKPYGSSNSSAKPYGANI